MEPEVQARIERLEFAFRDLIAMLGNRASSHSDVRHLLEQSPEAKSLYLELAPSVSPSVPQEELNRFGLAPARGEGEG